jgi:hypothetical protein
MDYVFCHDVLGLHLSASHMKVLFGEDVSRQC